MKFKKIRDYVVSSLPYSVENLTNNRLFQTLLNAWCFFKIQYHDACLITEHGTEERRKKLRLPISHLNNSLMQNNKDYRTDIIKASAGNKHVSMFVLSVNGHKLNQVLEKKFNYRFHTFKNRVGLNFTPSKFEESLKIAYAFLFAKFDNVYSFQLDATFIKILIEFFNPATLDLQAIDDIYRCSKDWEFDEIRVIISNLGLLYKSIKISKSKKPYTDFPSTEEYKKLLKYNSHSEIKQQLARKLNCSQKTVQRDMARKGVARKYKKSNS